MLQSMARNSNIDILNLKLFDKWKNHNQAFFVSMVWCKQKKNQNLTFFIATHSLCVLSIFEKKINEF